MSGEATVLPALHREGGDPSRAAADVLVVPVRRHDGATTPVAPALGDDAAHALREAATAIGHTGAAGSVARIPAPAAFAAMSVLLVGVGDRDGHEALRRAAGAALRVLTDVITVTLAFPATDAASAEAIATGALLGAYRYSAYSTAGGSAVERIGVTAPEAAEAALERASVIAGAVAGARDLVNRSPLDLYPASFADAMVRRAERTTGEGTVDVHIVDEPELRARGFGGLVGVGGGSARGPRLVRIGYAPDGARRHLAIVGKGITFDSGGISIKPAANMERMTSDMAGAAAAAQAVFAIAELGLPVRATAWLALAENMPSGSALRPADVLRMYGGKTVEVINTDAEGRLVLADALVAAQEESPDLLVDVATLTGAQVTALGRRTSGVMGTPAARAQVLRAAEAAEEAMWGMPIPEEMIASFESHLADLKNTGGPAGGMLGAAAFLREFVREGIEWAHLDIAGTAYNPDKPYGYTPLGGTGVPVRTLIGLAQDLV